MASNRACTDEVKKQALLYRTHFQSEMTQRELARLKNELPDVDVFVVGYVQEDVEASGQSLFYTKADLQALGYETKLSHVDWQKTTGHNDLPVLRFFRDHPGYDYYWIVEYDVRYTGRWSDLFIELNQDDCGLLATTITDFSSFPKWAWWSRKQLSPERVPLHTRWRAFLPFARASRDLLSAIDQAYLDGWAGHYEMAWPTICRYRGLGLIDIGGEGSETPAKWKRKHYSSSIANRGLFPGTFIFKPSFLDKDITSYGEWLMRDHMLWHPVKE